MDVGEDKVAQHRAHRWIRFGLEQFKKHWHALSNRFFRWRNMLCAPNENLVISISGQVSRLQNAGLDAGSEESLEPAGKAVAKYGTRIFSFDDSYQVFFNDVMRFVIASRGDGITSGLIRSVALRIPITTANILYEFGGDAIAFYR